MRILYTIFVGIPMSIACMTAGLLLCCTIIGIPIGLTLFASGSKVLTMGPR